MTDNVFGGILNVTQSISPVCNDCRITRVSAMMDTPVSIVSLMSTSVSRRRAKTTPPAGSARTRIVPTSPMPLQQALTASVFLDSMVSIAFTFIMVIISTVIVVVNILCTMRFNCYLIFSMLPVVLFCGIAVICSV